MANFSEKMAKKRVKNELVQTGCGVYSKDCTNFSVDRSCEFCCWNPNSKLGSFNLYHNPDGVNEHRKNTNRIPEYANATTYAEQMKEFGVVDILTISSESNSI